MTLRSRFLLWIFLLVTVLSACSVSPQSAQVPAPVTQPVSASPTLSPLPAPTLTPTATRSPALWISPAVPEKLRIAARLSGISVVENQQEANVWLEVSSKSQTEGPKSEWIYALVAAFPTVRDSVTFEELKAAWSGAPASVLMTPETFEAMKTIFDGATASGVQFVSAEGLTDALWQNRATWAIVPFEQLNPKLKVLELDGLSPLRKDFDAARYPLKVTFSVTPSGSAVSLPRTNRSPQKLVTVVMTGVTALVRATALKMEEKGILYPAQDVRDWLLEADITHISNEIPFAVGCPYPNPNQRRLIFCSDPRYIELLEAIGTDVVELTGNHFQDWGKQATLYTLEMYRQRGWPYFGGGADLADAQKPAIVERGGMKFAFIGCNPVGPQFAWAREDGWPGAAPCGSAWPGKPKGGSGYEWMVDEIARLKAEGYIVIATFQYFEYYSPDPRPWQQADFRRMADAGAVVVSGSQAHYSQAMEFYGNAFIHYGLGNLFFDQMGYDNPSSGQRTTNTRRAFIVRHVFYEGRHLGVELLTTMLEDYARPRPMTPEERQTFLEEYFRASGW
ncbi:MAG: CapA family protein [Anaerolineales bacterium]|nr:CapA family protein [Anaerolineales bacterium]MDW8276550.1 CapA family protein [Anaerolineales bacterium]